MPQTDGDRMSGIQFPFDIQPIRLPAAAANGLYCTQSAWWACQQIISDRGVVHTPVGNLEVREVGCVSHQPGQAYQPLNTNAVDPLHHFIPANPGSDACYSAAGYKGSRRVRTAHGYECAR